MDEDRKENVGSPMDKELMVKRFLKNKLDQLTKDEEVSAKNDVIKNDVINSKLESIGVKIEKKETDQSDQIGGISQGVQKEESNQVDNSPSGMQDGQMIIATANLGCMIKYVDIIENKNNFVLILSTGQNNFILNPCSLRLIYMDKGSKQRCVNVRYNNSMFSYGENIFIQFEKEIKNGQ